MDQDHTTATGETPEESLLQETDDETVSHPPYTTSQQSARGPDLNQETDNISELATKDSDGFIPDEACRPEVPDGGFRAWLVCLASCYCFGSISGVITTFGIVYVELLEEFKDEGGDIAFKTAWIGSLNSCLTFTMSYVVSMLVDVFGIRPVAGVGCALAVVGLLASSFAQSIGLMYFTFGILLGTGYSMVFVPLSAILPQYFKKHLGKVNGVVTFGGGVFTIALSFAFPVMCRKMGFRNALRVEAAISAVMCLAPIIWKPVVNTAIDSNDIKNKLKKICPNPRRRESSTNNACSNRRFLVWCVGLFFTMFGYLISFTHLINYCEETFPGSPANILVMCVGGITGGSRLLLGNLADHPAVKPNWILQTSGVMLAVCTSLVTFAPSFGVLVFIAVLMGICDGGLISMINPTVSDILGDKGVVQGIGIAWSMIGIATTSGPPLAGLMYDKMGTYQLVFLVGAMPMLIGPNIMFLMPSQNPDAI